MGGTFKQYFQIIIISLNYILFCTTCQTLSDEVRATFYYFLIIQDALNNSKFYTESTRSFSAIKTLQELWSKKGDTLDHIADVSVLYTPHAQMQSGTTRMIEWKPNQPIPDELQIDVAIEAGTRILQLSPVTQYISNYI